jgi:formiminotetrahydrofolate cyclodeaminase
VTAHFYKSEPQLNYRDSGYLMDAQRRYELKVILERLSTASNELRGLADEEKAAFNSIPHDLQQSDRAIAQKETSDILSEAALNVDDVVQALSLLLG